MKVFAAMYNPMTEESAYAVISLHLSKEGAERAILEHQREEKEEFEKIVDGEDKELYGEWDDFKSWTINEMEVLP